jgi:hypothetical protein
VLHSHNASPGARAQVVDVAVPAALPTSTTLKVSGTKKAGSELRLEARVAPKEATGTVRFLDGQTEVGSAVVTRGKATATVRLGAGSHALSAVFTSDNGEYAASTSQVVTVKVVRSGSSTSLTLSSNAGVQGAATTATVKVSGQTMAPTGIVEIRERGRVLGTGELVVSGRTGIATIALPTDLAVGTHQLTAVYPGNADVEPSQTQRSYRVTAPRPTHTHHTPTPR